MAPRALPARLPPSPAALPQPTPSHHPLPHLPHAQEFKGDDADLFAEEQAAQKAAAEAAEAARRAAIPGMLNPYHQGQGQGQGAPADEDDL